MARYRAHFVTSADTSVEFDWDRDGEFGEDEAEERLEALEEAAHRAFGGVKRCHSCAGEFNLGDDWEIPDLRNDIEEI